MINELGNIKPLRDIILASNLKTMEFSLQVSIIIIRN